jgi:hypothetical protein
VLLPFLTTLLFGIWEVGRFLDAQMLLEGACREGARQAAAGARRDPVTGNVTFIYAHPTSGQTDVETCVKDWLARSGINTANVTVTFTNLSPSAPVSPYTDKNDPYKANRLDQLQVVVTLPYNDVRWGPTQSFIQFTTTMSSSVLAYSNLDDPFSVNTTIPNN